MRAIEESEDKVLASEEFEQHLLDAVDKLEDDLMEIEMRLQYALKDAQGVYQDKIKQILKDMQEHTEKFVKVIENQASDFNTLLGEHAIVEFNQFQEKLENQQVEEDEENEDEDKLYELLSDKEILDTDLDKSKDYMSKLITGMEVRILQKIKQEQTALDDKSSKDQHARNRGIVREIIMTCQNFRNEIKEDALILKGEDDDGI